jgi:hypothetical protein
LATRWSPSENYAATVPAGAEAFKRDIPTAVVRFFDTGHFALETHAREIAETIRDLITAQRECTLPSI